MESINHSVPKRGGRGKHKGQSIKIHIQGLGFRKGKKSSFSEWYKDVKHRLLFTEGGF